MQNSIHHPAYFKLVTRLRDRRRKLGLRQEDVSQAINVHRSWIGKVDQRERRLDVLELQRLCRLYGLTWAEVEPGGGKRPG